MQLVSYKSKKNQVIAHFLYSNLPNHTKNTLSRQNIVQYILPSCILFVLLRQIITKAEIVKLLISILISHFSRNHSVSRSPSKLHWNLFERFFLDVHLSFTRAPASVHLTRKNAYAVVEQKKETARQRSPNPSLLSFLFSPAISAFVWGSGAYCVVVCCCVSGRIRFGFLRQTVLLFFSLFFSFPLLHHNLIQPNFTSILDHFFVEFQLIY